MLLGRGKWIGLMSGTSADGVDAVLLELGPERQADWQALGHRHAPFSPSLRGRILGASDARAAEVCRLHYDLGRFFAGCALALLKATGHVAADIAGVGSHGQTICHLPPRADANEASPVTAGATLQIGDGCTIAQETRITTVSDFRAADIAVCGQGAPLVPVADEILFGRHVPEGGVWILNLGGIANLTALGAEGELLAALDCGPGNMLMDAIVDRATDGQETYDKDGRRARQGKVNESLLAAWQGHPFFEQPAPRTAGREDFGASLLDSSLAPSDLDSKDWKGPTDSEVTVNDILRTAVELTVESVARSMEPNDVPACEVWVAGGGARNGFLMEHLARRLAPKNVVPLSARVPMEPEMREAAAFAVLARETLAGRPGNFPAATGATRPVVLGKVSVP